MRGEAGGVVGRRLAEVLLLVGFLFSLLCQAGCLEQRAERPAGGVFNMFGGGRRTLKQAQSAPQPASIAVDSAGRCTRDAVVNQRNPALWIYASGQGGLGEHGLSTTLLQTGGYPGDIQTVAEWKGAAALLPPPPSSPTTCRSLHAAFPPSPFHPSPPTTPPPV